jgi:hypothetical protein
LHGSGLKCNHSGVVWWCGGGGGGGGFFTDNNTTPTKLFCFVLCCWLDCGNTIFSFIWTKDMYVI